MAGQALLGLSAEDAIGHPIAGLAPERLRPVMHDEIWPALIRDSLWTGEAVLLARDGREVPVSVVAVAHRDADGTVEFLSAIVRDLTERKRIDAELRRQREALYQTEKLATMGTVLAGVAHELNNPLTAVTGYANLLRQELAGTPSASRAMSFRRTSCRSGGWRRASARKLRTIDAHRSAAWAMASARVADGVPASSCRSKFA